MRVVTLVENESVENNLKSAHGLSFYIEHGEKKILFDIGPGKQYLQNAKTLGIDIAEIDFCVISHGHFDHGKRIDSFLRANKKANVYISKHAFAELYKKKRRTKYIEIGIKKPLFSKRIIEIEEDTMLENGIKLYTKVPYRQQIIGDDSLFVKTGNGYKTDTFNHEIYMVLTEEKSNVLFTGCSHKGLENIIDTIEKNEEKPFTAVVGGFHLSHYDSGNLRELMYIEKLSAKLMSKPDVEYYTGHCTGDEAYLELKNTMKASLHRFKAGTEFKL